jgi:hypothetical protein
MTNDERREAAKWFENRFAGTGFPGASKMFRRALEALREGLDGEPEELEKYEPGELFIYVNGDRYEIGKVKRPNNTGDGYFCYYHSGDTAANTPTDRMHKLTNAYTIGETLLGGAME